MLLGSILFGQLSAGCAHGKTADLVLKNGKIVTLDEAKPRAQALAVSGDVILAVGSDAQIDAYRTRATKVVDLQGKLVVPGFIEGHGHFMSLGLSKLRLELRGAKRFADIVALVQAAARRTPPGEWIVGRGWHQEKWDRPPEPQVDGLPVHHALSRAAPDNPVLLTHVSGHSSLANAKAMQLAGVVRNTPDPVGGEIVRDAAGEPIGVFRENAQELLNAAWQAYLAKRTPAQVEAERRRAVELATDECLSKGVTSFQDAGASFELIDFYKTLAEEGKLGVRLWVMVDEKNERLKEELGRYRWIGLGGHRLSVRAIKRFMDGALGAHGAWLLEPYSDLPASLGLQATPTQVLRESAELAIQHDFQLCIHAIGDRANRETLDLYQEVFRRHPGKKDLRWRIEHAQHLHPDDISRFGRLGVIASMQTVHCTSDGPWVAKRLGEKRVREGAYAWQSLWQSGAVVSNGADSPVEDVDPIAGIAAAVGRRLPDGTVLMPEQRLSREQALRAYTFNAAWTAFEEHIKGSLRPGMLADLVVLSRDILTVAEEEISRTRVLMTVVGGQVVFQR